MNHPTETDIERIVLESPSVTPERKKIIHEHIGLCAFCREVYDALRDVHSEVTTHLLDEPSDQVKKIVDSIFQKDQPLARILQLFPAQRISSHRIERPTVIALAAMDTTKLPRYTTVQTLTTSDEQIFLKITMDNGTNSYLAQVISDDSVYNDTVLVSFGNAERLYVTNQNGLISLDSISDLNTNDLHALIHLSQAKFVLNQDQLNILHTRQNYQTDPVNNINLSFNFDKEKSEIHATTISSSLDKANTIKALVIGAEEKSEIFHFINNEVSIPIKSITPDCEIRIY